ncbi:lysine-specific demethylase 2A [Cyprinodon tularosa]|uniref:lysine-specific demethylase 2A n=1 Tax=Cyprinodon tularosa TaxID=77115 RepID=UPI0018E26811|nr:lysine-specific demethylase 2A [Cyprinodon tularosa]
MEDPHTRYSKRLRTAPRRQYQDDGISDDEIEGKRTFDLDEKLQCERFGSNLVKHMEGKDFTYEYIQREGLRDPIIFKTSDGLGLQMPDPDFSVSDVKVFVGSRRIVDVMDVNTQKGIEMSMAQWRRYYETPPSEREKLYNVISLEFSHTKLENLVKRPASVDLIDWVDNMWPRHLKERQRDSTNAIIDMHYPKVQKYCLMSVQGCFTDFHIDFGGTSVWYHILRGAKVFWLIPPTPQNLEMYENWVLSGKQGDIFLGDKCYDCQRIELQQGNTFIIPSGWIHAVYTPEDTLVFGGNFLHSFNIPMQLNIYNIEDRTRVPAKFRYPFYYEMCWYVLERYLFCLTNISHLTPEFQKYSLGIGLTPADVGITDPSVNGTNGVDGEAEEKHKEEEVKHEEDHEELKIKAVTPRPVLTPFEQEGLWNLLGKLEELPAHKKCVPAGIRNAAELLDDMRAVLTECASDNVKLAYTGTPIISWPKRPSWYQPPTPPAPVIYRPRLGPSLHKSKTSKKHTSISALRRRRVRCKRCSACCRKECGKCQYCHDMRKFGGPGRMKKSCVMRQCLMPALPNTARCAVCGEGEFDESDPSTYSLMECTACSQIVHRQCVKEPGEGKINKDLPSCWECPKCYQGLDSESESSSDEESDESEGSTFMPQSKRAYQEDNDVEGVRRRQRSRSPGRQTAPPPSQKLLLQHQQNRKRESALEYRLKKRIKLERSKLLRKQSSLGRSPIPLRSRLMSRLNSPVSRMSQGQSRGSPWASGSSHSSILGGNGSFGQQKSSHSLVLHPKGEPRRGHGRGVRLRGGGAGRGGGRHHVLEDDTEDSSGSTSNSSTSEEDDEDDEEEESGLSNGRGGDKENQPQSGQGQPPTEQEDCGSGLGNQNGGDKEDEEEDMEHDIPNGDKDGSFIKVTLQKPSRAKQDSSAIVPKLEAVAPQTATSPTHSQSKPLVRPPIRNRRLCPVPHTPPYTRSRQTDSRSSNPDRLEASTQTTPNRPAKLSNGASSSASSELHHLRVPLSALQEGGGEADREIAGSSPSCEREVWVSVFRYLNRADLCICMAVCKNWYKWCLDKRLWARIDLSIKRTVTPQALKGIIKRQPVTLDLSWTNISKKQLNWLIGRLPGLKDLMLSGCSWSSISALCSTGCPLLRSLDLRNAYGVKDAQIRDLVIPPGCDNRSQLRNMQCLRLAGLDIGDSTLRLIIRHMPHLTKLDLSHCNSVTDHSINLLTAVGSSTRNTLTELTLAGCSKLTDTCLKYLRPLSCISLLDLRGCKGVSRKACEAFISELSVNTLYCLSDEKLIQRIS